ncbi:MAG: GNAT family N-acetyltransferase [Actinomycetota bacterium]
MAITVRSARASDALDCGRICFQSFAAIADRHRFPRDFASVEEATHLISSLIESAFFFGVVAERDGEVIGSNFLDERSTVKSVGPVTVDPRAQDEGVGRALVTATLDRADEIRAPGVRLMQSTYHNRSLSLYAKMGFVYRSSFAVVQGTPPQCDAHLPIRRAGSSALDACDDLCRAAHGFDRHGEVRESIAAQIARVVEREGRVTAYTTGIGLFGHSVAESNADLQALIASADEYPGTGFLLPLHNASLLQWCLAQGLRVVSMMNLMTIGQYYEPRMPYLASVGY